MGMNAHWRAVDLLTEAANLTLRDCRTIAAEHTARGTLRSGATARRAVEAFDDRAGAAIDQMLEEVANHVETRGFQWRRWNQQVEKAVREHYDDAYEVIGATIDVAGAGAGDARSAIDSLLEQKRDDRIKKIHAFRDGWTAPRARSFIERHPVLYALFLVAAGVIISKPAEWAVRQGASAARDVLDAQPAPSERIDKPHRTAAKTSASDK